MVEEVVGEHNSLNENALCCAIGAGEAVGEACPSASWAGTHPHASSLAITALFALHLYLFHNSSINARIPQRVWAVWRVSGHPRCRSLRDAAGTLCAGRRRRSLRIPIGSFSAANQCNSPHITLQWNCVIMMAHIMLCAVRCIVSGNL